MAYDPDELHGEVMEEFARYSRWDLDSGYARAIQARIAASYRGTLRAGEALRQWQRRRDPVYQEKQRAWNRAWRDRVKPWRQEAVKAARQRWEAAHREERLAYHRRQNARRLSDPEYRKQMCQRVCEYQHRTLLARWEAEPPKPCATCGVPFKRPFQSSQRTAYCTERCRYHAAYLRKKQKRDTHDQE